MTYRDAGVDIEAGNELVERIKSVSKSTSRPEVLGNLGGFGALCKLPANYKNPVLVSGTDGVGTKLKLAIDTGIHHNVGIDLVAMCVNDLLVIGAEPLFFLDYYATGKLDVSVAESVITGIGKGCQQAGAALIGGETAEMPGMYQAGDYDLAGFCVGVVEEDQILDGSQVKEGDSIIAIASSGPHSNGYSLIRKILERSSDTLDSVFDGKSLAEHLLEPTRIYIKPVLPLVKDFNISAIAHITGGGLTENIPRVLPDNLSARINLDSWSLPFIFNWLKDKGKVDSKEMLRTFNCGVGLILTIPSSKQKDVIAALSQQGEYAWHIGDISPRTVNAVEYTGKL